MHLPRGSQATVDRVLSFLSANTKTINTTAEIAQVAAISTKGDVHVRNLNVQATEKVSREGVITVKEGCSIDARSRSPKGCGSIAGSSARLS
jgi:chaperonin GroEL